MMKVHSSVYTYLASWFRSKVPCLKGKFLTIEQAEGELGENWVLCSVSYNYREEEKNVIAKEATLVQDRVKYTFQESGLGKEVVFEAKIIFVNSNFRPLKEGVEAKLKELLNFFYGLNLLRSFVNYKKGEEMYRYEGELLVESDAELIERIVMVLPESRIYGED